MSEVFVVLHEEFSYTTVIGAYSTLAKAKRARLKAAEEDDLKFLVDVHVYPVPLDARASDGYANVDRDDL